MSDINKLLYPSLRELVTQIKAINSGWKVASDLFGDNSPLSTSSRDLKSCLQVRLLRSYAPHEVYLTIDNQAEGEPLYGLRLRESVDKVVEFFPGKGSETRLFPNNNRNQQILFGNSGLSVKRIRCLGGDRHDHVYLWQYYCREWLQENGIYTNPGTKPYTAPTSSQLQDRDRKFKKWKHEIEILEKEARDYC